MRAPVGGYVENGVGGFDIVLRAAVETEAVRVKYLILIHSNPASREVWERLSDAERVELGRGHAALSERLAASGG